MVMPHPGVGASLLAQSLLAQVFWRRSFGASPFKSIFEAVRFEPLMIYPGR
jgi:hypothetical protein